MKKALITGITGQDGSYLAEFLLDKGYEVHGVLRRASSFNTGRIEHLYIDELIYKSTNFQLNIYDFIYYTNQNNPTIIKLNGELILDILYECWLTFF